jgi:hypothetical protein
MRRHSSACHSACSAQTCTSPTDFGERLALVERDVPAYRLGARPRQLAHLAQDGGAFQRGGAAPGLERALRGQERMVEILAARVRELRKYLAARRVVHRLRLATLRRYEFAVDVEGQRFVGGCFLRFDNCAHGHSFQIKRLRTRSILDAVNWCQTCLGVPEP